MTLLEKKKPMKEGGRWIDAPRDNLTAYIENALATHRLASYMVEAGGLTSVTKISGSTRFTSQSDDLTFRPSQGGIVTVNIHQIKGSRVIEGSNVYGVELYMNSGNTINFSFE